MFEQNAVARPTRDWVEPFPGHTIVSNGVVGDTVSVVLAGPPLDGMFVGGALAAERSACAVCENHADV